MIVPTKTLRKFRKIIKEQGSFYVSEQSGVTWRTLERLRTQKETKRTVYNKILSYVEKTELETKPQKQTELETD